VESRLVWDSFLQLIENGAGKKMKAGIMQERFRNRSFHGTTMCTHEKAGLAAHEDAQFAKNWRHQTTLGLNLLF